MKLHSQTPTRIAKIGYVAVSAVICAAGVLLILRPALSLQMITRALGIVMLVFGAVKLVGYFARDLFRLAFQYDLEFGILLLVLGTVILVRPLALTRLLCLTLGLVILTDSLFKLRIALDAKRFGIGSWWSILLFAALAGTVGTAMLFLPGQSSLALTAVLGAALLAEGILNLCVALGTVKVARRQYADAIESDDDQWEADDR